MTRLCLRCGKEFVVPTRGNGINKKFCSIQCKRNYATTNARRRLKQRAVDLLGGKCSNPECGYNRCIDAMEFHHRDPSHKDFAIGQDGCTRSWARIVEELKKCILLCNRCHREVHSGVLDIDC